MAENGPTKDLPLMSNIKDILVTHYNLSFKCDFESKRFVCSAILFLKPAQEDSSCEGTHPPPPLQMQLTVEDCESSPESVSDTEDCIPNLLGFALILDCNEIAVKEVSEIPDNMDLAKFSGVDPFTVETAQPLNFSSSHWALRIWKNDTCPHCFPRVIHISYETLPSSSSLLWVEDQNGDPSVFTYGSAVNNRALFPCQEPPVAMATWEATVFVTNSALVLMSGDMEANVSQTESGTNFYYYTKKVLPASTLCLAIGFWKEHRIVSGLKNQPTCRIFVCSSLLEKSVREFSDYILECLIVSDELLGPYPFPRIDFLIVPPTSGSLGLASPNLIFLSQSLLAGDRSLCSRVAHEVSHGFFGLSIGTLDTTEEWMSEGFATFIEDFLHTKIVKNPHPEDYMELKSLIRKKLLVHELKQTEVEYQILRPFLGAEKKGIVDGMLNHVVKNGKSPVKSFLQVHYIKGYFLLRHLCDTVGSDAFLFFLKKYTQKFEGHLISSLDFFNFFFESFPTAKYLLSLESIYENWLHNPGIPEEIKNMDTSSGNPLVTEISKETEKWKELNTKYSRRQSKRRKCSLEHFSVLTSDQLILVLENLLNEETLSSFTLQCLNKAYKFNSTNAEVQHRWFELVTKWKYRSQYDALKHFMINHLGMGVYLYGETILSGDRTQKAIAEECYSLLKEQMEPSYRQMIDNMFSDAAEL